MLKLRRLLALAATFAAALGASASGADWSAIKPGMTRDQVARSIGVPVLCNAARGHETWIYDAGGDVQFRGGIVLAWTAPPRSMQPAHASPPDPATPLMLMPEISPSGGRAYGTAQRPATRSMRRIPLRLM